MKTDMIFACETNQMNKRGMPYIPFHYLRCRNHLHCKWTQDRRRNSAQIHSLLCLEINHSLSYNYNHKVHSELTVPTKIFIASVSDDLNRLEEIWDSKHIHHRTCSIVFKVELIQLVDSKHESVIAPCHMRDSYVQISGKKFHYCRTRSWSNHLFR